MRLIVVEQEDEPPGRVRPRPLSGVGARRWNDWRWQLRNRVSSLEQLASIVPIPKDEWEVWRRVVQMFRFGVTPYYLSLFDPTDPKDPLARQSLPSLEEFLYRDVGEDDPLHEEADSPVPGLTHRYPDRVLMVISNHCAMYCRHCTRKRLMAAGAVPRIDLDRMVDYIARHREVRDVIVSGGDPLTLSTARLEEVLRKLRAIPHVEVIRIGTRVPCVLPMRVTDELCEMLARYHPVWVNVQFEHPRECTPEAERACDRLLRAGIPLNNQSVLLRGVNDDPETMRELIQRLMRMRVRPYYLFQCDPVRGAEHFRTPISRGIEILEQLRGHTGGLSVPTYVVDLPGGGGKVPVGPDYLLSYDAAAGRAVLRNYQGRHFEYLDPTPPEEGVMAGGSTGSELREPRRTATSAWLRSKRPRRTRSRAVVEPAPLDIGIACDLRSDFASDPNGPTDRLEEYDDEETIAAIAAALQAAGHSVRRLGGGRSFVERVLADPPDLVFNIAEGRGTRSREAHVPALLEMLGIPCTHSDPLTLALTLDKAMAKRIVAAAGVPTPAFSVVRTLDELDAVAVPFPVVAKPLWEGSSIGVRNSSRATDRAALEAEVRRQLADYGQPVLVEEFCPGAELTVGVLCVKGKPTVLGVMEVVPRHVPLEEFVYSLEVKRDYLNQVEYRVPPDRPRALLARAEDVALAAFAALDCRDVARVDLRVGSDGEPRFIEVNPLPGINPVSSDLVIMARVRGWTYEALIAAIVAAARARLGR